MTMPSEALSSHRTTRTHDRNKNKAHLSHAANSTSVPAPLEPASGFGLRDVGPEAGLFFVVGPGAGPTTMIGVVAYRRPPTDR